MKILVIDDEENIGRTIELIFAKENFDVTLAFNGETAISLLKENYFDVIISDIRLPDISGMEILKTSKNLYPEVPVIMITAYASTSVAVEAMKLGAEDYIIKPFDIDELRIIVKRAYEKRKLEIENKKLQRLIEEKYSFENIIGKSKIMKNIFLLIEKIAPIDTTVLITGESGTGKDLIARAIHFRSLRKEGEFVAINCASIPENLLESELFGYKRGAFTGAVTSKVGLFQEANKGTLFLDEIGEMPQGLQSKLLRVLQDKKIRPLGDTQEKEVDVRIIAATNHNLEDMVKRGDFREDLFYRLNVITIDLPPLRKRKEDIPLLVNHFIKKLNKKLNKEIKGVEPSLLEYFFLYDWPGNVRELENIVERLMILEEGTLLTSKHLPKKYKEVGEISEITIPSEFKNFNLNQYIDNVIKKIISLSLEKTGGNKKEAASLLGISYRSFRYYYNKLFG